MSLTLKLLIPSVAIVAALVAIRRSRSASPGDFGLRSPAVGPLAIWVAAFAAWMLASDAIWHWRGPWNFAPWLSTPLAAAVGRVLAIGFLGPIAEELIFRGVLYTRLAARRMGVGGAIVVTAVLWALLHVSDPLPVVALLAVDGLALGAARAATGSVWVPVAMHVVWNLYAVW